MATKRNRAILEEAKSAGKLVLHDGIWLWTIRLRARTLTIGYGRNGGPIPEVATTAKSEQAARRAFALEVNKSLKKGFRTPEELAQEAAARTAAETVPEQDDFQLKWKAQREKERLALYARIGAPLGKLVDEGEGHLDIEEDDPAGKKPSRLRLLVDDSEDMAATLASLSAIAPPGDLDRLALHLVYDATYQEAVAALQKGGLPAWVKTLTLCSFRNIEDFDAASGDPTPLYPAMAGLERLEIHAGRVILGTMNFPRLRDLQVRAWGLSREALQSITAAQWPVLERLSLWFGGALHGADCTPADLASILSGERFPKLKHLQLMTSEFTDQLPGLLAASPLLPRLKSLDLSFGTLSDAGAAALKKKAAAFRHLGKLRLEQNLLSNRRVSELAKALPKLEAGEQREPGNWVRATGVEHYVPLYAGEGCIELWGIDDQIEEPPLELDLELDRSRK